MADDKVDTKTCTANRFILAGLGGTLAATILIIIISLVLSPADVSFSVSHASRHVSINGTKIVYLKLALTVAASNPSRRCKVNYQSIFVDVKKAFVDQKKPGSTGITSLLILDLPHTTFPTGYIKGPNATLMNASATLQLREPMYEARSFANQLKNFTAVVRAVVRFKIGVIRTRLYEIKVSCPGVFFPEEGSSSSAEQGDFECSA